MRLRAKGTGFGALEGLGITALAVEGRGPDG